jgi:O-antigen ligase
MLIKSPGLKQRWIYLISTVILSAGLIQLSSRAVFLAFLLFVNLVLPFFLFHGKKRLLFFLITALISTAVIMLIYNVDSFKTRYVSELKTDLAKDAKLIENVEPRLARWNAIRELIQASPVIGYGTGSEKKLLKEKYFEKGLYISYLNEFNTHNEYLSILVRTGVIGLALFIYILYFGFAAAARKQDVFFLGFMVMITIVAISENILELNKGIFFYSFFFPAFLYAQFGKGKRADLTIKGQPS